MKTCGEVEVKLHIFLSTARGAVYCQVQASVTLPPVKQVDASIGQEGG
jgi:hypothetical protein